MLCKSFLTLLRSLHLSYEALVNHDFSPDYISFSSSKSQKDELCDCFWQWLVYIPRFISTRQSWSRAICSETQRGSFSLQNTSHYVQTLFPRPHILFCVCRSRLHFSSNCLLMIVFYCENNTLESLEVNITYMNTT